MLSRSIPSLLGISLLWLLALGAPAALAETETPFLLGTNPQSPGTSTEPRIVGRVGDIGTSVVHPADTTLPAATTSGVGPSATVAIYTDAGCLGPVVATGSVTELEFPGVRVEVLAGSTTTFYATATDAGETSGCSAGVTYRHVTAPPPSPTVVEVNPVSGSDNNFPRVFGDAAEGSAVTIYADPGCTGLAVGSGSAAAFKGSGVQVAVADNSTTTFYAAASWAGFSSACSSTSVTYQETTQAPPPSEPPPSSPPPVEGPGVDPAIPVSPGRPAAPRLRTLPGARSNVSTPLLTASAVGAVKVDVFGSADCSGPRLVSGSADQLATGIPVKVAENATTRFSAVSVDSDGDRSQCSPEPAMYVEDSAPPLTKITFGPSTRTRKTVAIFRFADVTDDPPGTSFSCRVDSRPWRACQSPLRLQGLRRKAHVLQVKATDAAGNAEPTGAKRRFKVVRASR